MKNKTQKIAYNSTKVISIKKIKNRAILKIKVDYKLINLYQNLKVIIKIIRMILF